MFGLLILLLFSTSTLQSSTKRMKPKTVKVFHLEILLLILGKSHVKILDLLLQLHLHFNLPQIHVLLIRIIQTHTFYYG
jgi:hypothetical protein